MQTRADAEIVVYSDAIQKPGDQIYEAQNDRQENSQGCPKSKKLKSKPETKQGQGRNQSRLSKGCRIQYHSNWLTGNRHRIGSTF